MNNFGASAVFELWIMEVGLRNLMIEGASMALEHSCVEASGFEVITKYLDNNFVHLLDPTILQVLHDKMSTITQLTLSDDEQQRLR